MDINTLAVPNATIMILLLTCEASMFILMVEFAQHHWPGRHRVENVRIDWNSAMASIGWNG